MQPIQFASIEDTILPVRPAHPLLTRLLGPNLISLPRQMLTATASLRSSRLQQGATPWRAARRGGAASWREAARRGGSPWRALGVGPHRGVHQLGVGRQRAWGSPGRLSARSSQSARRPFRGDASSARAARVGTAESTQVDRAEGSKRERDEGPKRERSVPVLLSYRREAF